MCGVSSLELMFHLSLFSSYRHFQSLDGAVGSSLTSASIPNYSGSTPIYYGRPESGTPAILSPFDIQQMEQESGQEQMMQLIPDQDY